MLNDVGLEAEYSDPAMAFAARYMTRLAHDVWGREPEPLIGRVRSRATQRACVIRCTLANYLATRFRVIEGAFAQPGGIAVTS